MKVRYWQLGGFLAALFVAPFLLMALGQYRHPYDVNTVVRYLAPSWNYPFGTDALGRDMLARTLYATGLSLQVVTQSVAVSFVLALLLGGISGYAAGMWPDHLISWVISLLYTIPFFLIVMAVFAVLAPGIEGAYLVIGCIGWAAPARLVRAEVIRLRGSPFILAERTFGYPEWRILFRTVLPLSFLPAFLSLLYFVPELIGVEVGLSFFGLGAQPPTPSLGRLIYDGLSDFYTGWHLTFIPATMLLILMGILYQATHWVAKHLDVKHHENA
jgi:ABC-type dipeptide/oligopeptide/nickel transport system permease subunit